jgi:Zn ribbon nucleic-acid-binding protein
MICQRCREREGTEIWSENGVFGYTHGLYGRWCPRCVTQAQLTHARQMAANVIALETKLTEQGGPWEPASVGMKTH